MCSDHSDRKAREDHRNEVRPVRPLSMVQQAHAAADARRLVLSDMYALQGRPLARYGPDELARKVESMAGAAGVSRSTADPLVWASLLAVCLDGWCVAARAQELDVSAGEAA